MPKCNVGGGQGDRQVIEQYFKKWNWVFRLIIFIRIAFESDVLPLLPLCALLFDAFPEYAKTSLFILMLNGKPVCLLREIVL